MEAIILAGGVGSRLKEAVSDVPKPMAPVSGRPFLEYLLDYWSNQGVTRVVLSVGYKHHIIEQHFSGRYKGMAIDYAVETQPRGTGGGLLLALVHLREAGPFLVLNGDTFFEVALAPMHRFHEEKNAEVTIALRSVESNSRYAGVEMDRNNSITAFDNRVRTSGRTLINGGVYLAERAAFSGMPMAEGRTSSLEDELYPSMLATRRRLYGYPSQGRFIDIGIPDDYRRAAEVLLEA